MTGAAASSHLRTLGARQRAALEQALAWLDRLRPLHVVGFFVVAEWIAVAALALVIRHNHWVYYQGGDQLWSYTSGWLLAHGTVASPLVGYLWAALLAPLTWIVGPNLVGAYPVIVVVDTAVLLPLALACLYGLARLIAGRRFAVLALTVWLLAPFAGVLLTDAGYHQRYTELTLPQAFGLTAMTDFPTMVAALAAAYFVARVIFDGRDTTLDALAAGVAAGAAIGIKPSTALFLAGPAIALALTRRFRAIGLLVVGLLPAVVTLTLWKWRGYGYVPLLHGSLSAPARSAAGPGVVGIGLPQYAHFDWSHFLQQLDLLREHFWSGRLIEWLVVAGLIAIGLRSRAALGLIGGWFVAFALVKGGYGRGSIEDSSLLRLLIPAIPAFVLLIASLPYLVPRGRRPWPAVTPTARAPRRLRLAAVGATLLLTAVVPFAAIAASTPMSATPPQAVVIQQPLIPVTTDLGVTVHRSGAHVNVSWDAVHSAGGAVFYHVYRAQASDGGLDCDNGAPAILCQYKGTDLGATTQTAFTDTPPSGSWEYRVGVSANWLDDPTLGDVYELSRPVPAR